MTNKTHRNPKPKKQGKPKPKFVEACKLPQNQRLTVTDIGSCSKQGRRPHMEDFCDLDCDLSTVSSNLQMHLEGYAAVYDGHCGDQTARYLQKHLKARILGALPDIKRTQIKQQLRSVFSEVETDLFQLWKAKDSELGESGSTAVCVMVFRSQIVCANVGDSRAVLYRGGRAVPLSNDHRPSRKDERDRIAKLGIEIQDRYVVMSGYEVSFSRSFGDFQMKPKASLPSNGINAIPEITFTVPTNVDSFIISASDGLWDVLTNEEAVRFVAKAFKGKKSATQAADALVRLALSKKSQDNVTAVVMQLGVVEGELLLNDDVKISDSPSQGVEEDKEVK